MPYQAGQRLPAERASRLGHLEVLKSDLVNKLCRSFEDPNEHVPHANPVLQGIPQTGQVLPLVFGVDGSMQVIQSETPPHKALGFVKTALLRLDQVALSAVDKDSPHPFVLRDILADSAVYHATVFPMRHVTIPGVSVYDAVREIIFESMCDCERQPIETLKWLAYEKWDGSRKALPAFECPHCEKTAASLPYDAEEGKCPQCGGHLLLTDMLGFHQEMAPDSAPDTIATSYMTIHETLLLFTGIRYFWESDRRMLSKCLFVKDGPLSIRAQYSKLVNPIRRLLAFCEEQGHVCHIVGQEKTGAFFEHLQLIERSLPPGSLFVPGDRYIKEEIQHRPDRGAPYGKDTNYGAKVFVKLNEFHHMVLNIPTGAHIPNPELSDLLGGANIFATLPTILSNRYEGALLPVELANGIASLATYPSAQILKVFAESAVRRND